MEGFAQGDRKPSPTPVRMFGHQSLERFEIFGGHPAALNQLGSKHSRFLAHPFSGSQQKTQLAGKFGGDPASARRTLNTYKVWAMLSWPLGPQIRHLRPFRAHLRDFWFEYRTFRANADFG